MVVRKQRRRRRDGFGPLMSQHSLILEMFLTHKSQNELLA